MVMKKKVVIIGLSVLYVLLGYSVIATAGMSSVMGENDELSAEVSALKIDKAVDKMILENRFDEAEARIFEGIVKVNLSMETGVEWERG